MKRVFAKHEPYMNGHLGVVVEEMKLTGPPTIRCLFFNGDYYAIEGSHRLAAADILGLCPKIVKLKPDISYIYTDDLYSIQEHWARVAETLPCYEFDHILVFDFEKFEQEITEFDSI